MSTQEISADLVKKLRDATNVSMMECKRALVESGGSMEKAQKLLRERGIAIATKKATRTTNQGIVASVVTPNGTASLIEVNCETDFVARNENFRQFVARLAADAAQTDAPLADKMKAELTAKIAEIGENMVIRRNARFVLNGKGMVGSYIHLGGKVGVLVEVNCTKDETAGKPEFRELVKDLTLHIAACSPAYLTAADVPPAVVTSEREIYAKQVQGKPAQVLEKIVDGKLKKFYTETCLVDQLFVKDPKQSITALLTEKGKALGDSLTIRRFLRYQLGVE